MELSVKKRDSKAKDKEQAKICKDFTAEEELEYDQE
jgi:hypothetical protein